MYDAAMRIASQIIAVTGCVSWLLSATPPAGIRQDTDAIQALVRAYPECLVASEEPNTILWKDGTEMVFDDGVRKADFEDLLNRASLKDQMSMPYPRSWLEGPPAVNDDPGRVRNEAFFRKMYGDSAGRVEANLVLVEWLNGKSVRLTKINGAAEALRRVRAEIRGLPADVQRYVSKPIGAFQWRDISGTKRLSMHSFGAALDFQFPKPIHRYWMWDIHSPKDMPVYPDPILQDSKLKQVVAIFERHGFIWGGKWFHYDTMHFEYRPELLQSPRTRWSGKAIALMHAFYPHHG